MISAGHHTMMKRSRPYDYRVAYFQRTINANSGRFSLPSVQEMNPAVEDLTAIHDAINQANFRYSVDIGMAPGSGLSGDKQFFGQVGWYCLFLYNGKWRPGGVNKWPTQPTVAQMPLVTDNVVRCAFTPSGYELSDSDGHTYSLSYAHGSIDTTLVMPVLISPEGVSAKVQVGARYFGSSVHNDHPTYGFSAEYIPVIKDGEPYIYDITSGAFFGKIGGDIGIGRPVPDKFNPLTDWLEG